MRFQLRGDTFPPQYDITTTIIKQKSKIGDSAIKFIHIYYHYIVITSGMLGFNLIRLEFERLRVIIHRPNIDTWIFDFTDKYVESH